MASLVLSPGFLLDSRRYACPHSFRVSCFHFPFPGLSGLVRQACQALPGSPGGKASTHRTRALGRSNAM